MNRFRNSSSSNDEPSDDDQDALLLGLAAELILLHPEAERYGGPKLKISHHDGLLTGRQWVEELINGHYRRIIENCRISVDNFLLLCDILKNNNYVPQNYQKRVEIEEALAMALVMVSHSARQRVLAERFNRSTETINRNVREVLRGLCMFASQIIRPFDYDQVHPRIGNSTKYYPWFKDAVGAIDGTHIPACPPSGHQMAYTNRHGFQSQNLLAVCDFDMRFTYIYAGWEGSAHDARVLDDALSHPSDFPMAPEGKYYLVDAAYKNVPGFLPPYKNAARAGPEKILFNTRHSELRNVIERTFGVLKNRFKFLKGPVPNFYMTTQVNVVIACCALHNFLRLHQPGDAHFQLAKDGNVGLEHQQGGGELPHVQPLNASRAEVMAWKARRDAIATEMYGAQRRRRR
ncbi:uncharacterized protein [Coffea arabica]|uniref:Nuclease HARBI1 n=1 Tax=Coffea arabica TaxID=13443 RepID=A0A6P6S6B3_COFAR|nr:putative nuclease HARBI1 [Coffea arabica]